jgi:hypothetical protein
MAKKESKTKGEFAREVLRQFIDKNKCWEEISNVIYRKVKGERVKNSLTLKNIKERGAFMNLAKVSSNGQITVPVEIRRKLNISIFTVIYCRKFFILDLLRGRRRKNKR